MKQFELNGILREKLTKGQMNDLRGQGYVPGVLYGDKIEENINLFFFINDLHDLIYTDDVYQITLKVEGKLYKTVIKNMQFHPLSDLPIHIDFMEVSDDKVVKIWYPIHFKGVPAGTMEGGKVFKKMRKLRVKGAIAELPDTLEVSIAHLKIGDSLKVRDISIPNVEILIPEATPLVTVARARVSTVEEVVVEGEESEEGEEAEGEETSE